MYHTQIPIKDSSASMNYLAPFTALSAEDSRNDVEERLARLRSAGIYSMNLLWSSHDEKSSHTLFIVNDIINFTLNF